MPCAADDPFARLLPGGESLDRVERLADGLRPTHIHHVFRETGGLEMRVGIDQPRNHSLAGQIENTGPRADEGFDRGVASCCEYFAILNGQRLHDRRLTI